ncbi:neprilysin-2-like isoform X1 [Zophobas morio]|uniref:neprilysin-2-like isoform X1 n=2 Tax=Zophobas morio TaxID=2755281 RepID=UPI0030839038
MVEKLPKEKKFSWWERQTRIEKCLLVLTGFSVVVITYLMSNFLMTFPPTREGLPQDVCLTEKCIRSAAHILEKIDETVDPCDDFYKFACGNFVKNTIIPDDKVMVSSFSDTRDKVNLQLMNLLEEPDRDHEPSHLKLLKKVYKSCMNTKQIETEGLTFVKNGFKDLGGWPVVEPYWNDKIFDWKSLLYRIQKSEWRESFFFSMHVGTDYKDSTKVIFTITQPSMYYETLKKGFNDTTVKAMYNHMVEFAVLFGADRATAISDMKDVIDFRIELAKLIIPDEEEKNKSLNYNPVTIRELQKNYPSLSWLKLINNYLSPIDTFTSDDIINVAIPKYMDSLETFLPNIKKRTLANYMFSTILERLVTHLPEQFRRKEAEYERIAYTKNEATPRWKTCVWQASRLHIAMSSIHIKHMLDKLIKHKVTELVADIKSSFLDTLKKVGWMDQKTKKHAVIKAEKMSYFIGYPEELLDDNNVEDYYQGLELNGDEYSLKVHFNLSRFLHMKHFQELRIPVNNEGWKTQAYTFKVNAFYIQVENTIELPAAVLQDNFFDPDRPQYLNYGALGDIIGHEITHGFDSNGRQYDKNGNVIDWWEPETNRTFGQKSQCLVDQYSNYTIPESEINLNGLKTLAEDIADNGGIKIAYRGYLKWLERNKPELPLPALRYTPRQLFWISAATNSCAKVKKEYLKQSIRWSAHSPDYFRILVSFMNSDYFGRDFNCPLGSPMNPKYKCSVW